MINIKKTEISENKKFYTDKNIRNKIRKIIEEDFFNLCYLCETHNNRGFQIEHFFPKGKNYFPEKINDWNNLFLSCPTCNQVKPKSINTKKSEEILNPCLDDVENAIELRKNNVENGQEKIKIEITSSEKNNYKIENTIKLLERIYNGCNSESLEYMKIRKEISEKIRIFEELLKIYKGLKLKILKKPYENKIIEFLQKSYNLEKNNIDFNKLGFISFKRQIIKDNPDYKEFEKYFD